MSASPAASLAPSLPQWAQLDEGARKVVLDQLLERLPSWLELAEPGTGLRFRDNRSGETWRLFHGGQVTLGATLERLANVEDFQRANPLTTFDPTVFWPVREVTVSPFLLMEDVIQKDGDAEPFYGGDVRRETQKKLDERGQRLPTEAEWEFAWWTVQQEREHWVSGHGELCADGWRPHLLELAAVDPMISGGPQVVRAGSFDPTSIDSLLPRRLPYSAVRLIMLRPALSVPALE